MSTAQDPTPSSTAFPLNPIFSYPTLNDKGQNVLFQIASIFEAGEPPQQETLLMDGTHHMMVRSLDTACATNLTGPLPAPTPTSSLSNESRSNGVDMVDASVIDSASLSFQTCRQCTGEYVFQLQSGTGSVTVVAGVPKPNAAPYKTMSYVWGALPETHLFIPCLQCGYTTPVPMLNAQRFHNLMELGGSNNTIWLDALSIDQFNARDVAANLAVMGDIYKNAKCVSVLLPASDKGAYDCLEAIERDAKIILFHCGNFIENSGLTINDPSTGESVKVLSMVCQLFLENLKRLGEHLHQFGYWSRAWTFQEWALARDLEVAVEGGSSARTVFNIKSLVLGAAVLISRYKILQHDYVEIELGDGLSRGMIPPIFNAIKALFPDEDLFLSYEEIDVKKVSFQANFPHLGVTDLLGIRSIPAPSPDTPDTGATATSISLNGRPDALSRTRARLILLLSAFASSVREAKYEADLVACWASMCNITYAYNRTDNFVTALRKAVKALRAQGIVIYDFLPDTTSRASSPVAHFRAYAHEHPQLNATNNAEFPGAPIFTGRADTVSHLIYSLDKVNLPTQWNDCKSDERLFGLRLVLGSKVEESIALDDLDIAMNAFAAKVLYGNLPGNDGFMFWPAHEVAKLYLEKVQAERRAMARLVIVKLPFYKHDSQPSSSPHDLFVWAVVPIDIALEEFITCREPINGTLTLVIKKDGQHHIAAYLTLSDHLSGTFLVNSDEDGKVDLNLRISERGDVQYSGYKQVAERQLRGEVRLAMADVQSSSNQAKVNLVHKLIK